MIFLTYANFDPWYDNGRAGLISQLNDLQDYESGYGGWPAAFLNWHASVKLKNLDKLTRAMLDRGLEPNMDTLILTCNADHVDPRVPADVMEAWVVSAGEFVDRWLTAAGREQDGSTTKFKIHEGDENSEALDPSDLTSDAVEYIADALRARGVELVHDDQHTGVMLNGSLWPRWDLLPTIRFDLFADMGEFGPGSSPSYIEALARSLILYIPWTVFQDVSVLSSLLVEKGAIAVLGSIFGTKPDAHGQTCEDPYALVDLSADRSIYRTLSGHCHWRSERLTEIIDLANRMHAAFAGTPISCVNYISSSSQVLSLTPEYAPPQAQTPTHEWFAPAFSDKTSLPPSWCVPYCTSEHGLEGFIDCIGILYTIYRCVLTEGAALKIEDERVKSLKDSGAIEGDPDDKLGPKIPASTTTKTSILPFVLAGAAAVGVVAAASSNKTEDKQQDGESASSPKE